MVQNLSSEPAKLLALSIKVHPGVLVGGCAHLSTQTIFIGLAARCEKRHEAKEENQPHVLFLVAQDWVHFRQDLSLRETFRADVPSLDVAEVRLVSTIVIKVSVRRQVC